MDLIATVRTDSGDSVGSVIVPEKAFASGSAGYFGQRKLEWAGERWQVQVQLVRIGSKAEPQAEQEAAPDA